jgi:hypothetical protein
VAPLLQKEAPALEPAIDAVEGAASEPARRFELLYLLARNDALSHQLTPWHLLKGSSMSVGGKGSWWCALADPPKANPPAPVVFLPAEDRKAAREEWRRLQALGSGPTFVNAALAQVAAQVPPDERVAEALHLAVRGSRRACRDDRTTAATGRAFRVLHKRFPKSEWAKRTGGYH